MKLKTILIIACLIFVANYASSQVVYQKDGKIYMEFGKYNEYSKNAIDYKSKIRPGVTPSTTADYWGAAVTSMNGTNEKPYRKLEIAPGFASTGSNWASGVIVCTNLGSGWRLPMASEWVVILMFRSQLADMGVKFNTDTRIDPKTGVLSNHWLLNETAAAAAMLWTQKSSLIYTLSGTVKTEGYPIRCVREVPVGE